MILSDREIIERVEREHIIDPFVDRQVTDGVVSYGLSSYGYDMRIASTFKVVPAEYPYEVRKLSDVEAAWLAGLFDGEGYLPFSEDKRGSRPVIRMQLGITMANEETISKVHNMTGIGNVYHNKSKNPKHSDTWSWIVGRTRHIQELVLQLLPYLTVKRESALRAIKLVNLASMPVLDPKAIDENLFEDVVVEDHGYIEIPANSFVLGHSVEYFRIPRDIMGLCLGKSTYARSGVTVHITPLEAGWQGVVTIEVANNAPVPVRVYANEGIAQVLFLKPNKPSLVSYADRAGKYQNQVGITLPKILGIEKVKHQRKNVARGEDVPSSKLTEDQVREIWMRLSNGESSRKIAKDYSVSKTTILAIKNREAWRHTTDELIGETREE